MNIKRGGKLKLVVSSIGYTSTTIDVDIKNPKTAVEKIFITPGVQVESVTVSAIKPLIKSDIDKVTYSVEADPESSVSTALDILRKVPLISVDADDNVLLQGQSNYKVLVNGKSSSLISKNFKEVIRSMPANSIKDIEVITNPSSKYEAEGVGGIINIITNRKNDNGYNGSIGINGNTFGGYGANGYLTAKLGKFSMSANVYAGYYAQADNTQESYRENRISDENKYENMFKRNENEVRSTGVQLEASYEIDTFNLISLSFQSFNGTNDYISESNTIMTNIYNDIVSQYRNYSQSKTKYGSLSGNIDYQRTFKKPDKTITASYRLEGSPDKMTSISEIDGVINYMTYGQLSINDASSYEHTFQFDYNDPLTTKHNIEAGAKYILRQNNSNPDTYRRDTPDDEWKLDPKYKNNLKYDQHIIGVYGAYTFKLKKFSAKAGARFEGTINDGVFTSEKAVTKFDNPLFNVVPYATLSYSPKQSRRLSMSYTQRLARPGIWYLNPYVDDMDPSDIWYGNPNLKSEISHSFNGSYGIYEAKHTFSLNANAAFTNNSIQSVTTINDEGVRSTTYYNIGKRDSYSANVYYSFRPNAKFSISANISGNYTILENETDKTMKNDGFGYNGNINTRISLWKDGAFTANAYYSSPSVRLQGTGSSFYYYSLGLSQKILKKKVTINIYTTNPFQKYSTNSSKIDTPTFYQYTDGRFTMRQGRISLTYNFGKMNIQVKKASRGINNDDLKSGDDGGGSSK